MERTGGFLLAASFLIAGVLPADAQQNRTSEAPIHLLGIVVGPDGEARIVCRRHAGAPDDVRNAAATNRMARSLFEPISDLSTLRWHDEDVFVAPRPTLDKARRSSATFQVDYSGFSSEARAAFQYAVDIWATRIVSNVTIHVEASWSSLDENVLGSAGPTYFDDADSFSDPNEPASWFVPALANAKRGTDDYPDEVDVVANFNSDFDNWYFGLDGQTPPGMIDFVTIVLHEIGHGVGFLGSMKVDDGADDAECDGTEDEGCWGFSSYPDVPVIYDRFAGDSGANPLIDTAIYPNPSAALGDVLQGGPVLFAGDASVATYGGARPPLYVPPEWEKGSSYAHLDEATFSRGDPSALMTPSVSSSEAVHDPGPIGCAVFADIGWTTTADCGTLAEPETPAVPVLLSPPDGAKGLDTTVVLEWTDVEEADRYRVRVDTDSGFADPFVNATDVPSSSLEISGLVANTTYFWRVRSENEAGAGAWSSTFRFATFAPVPVVPEVIHPARGATDVSIPTEFAWSEAAEADYYDLQVALDSAFIELVVDSMRIDSTHLVIHTLEPATSYYWRVRAINDIGDSVWTLGAEFKTVVNTADVGDGAAADEFGFTAAYPNPFHDRIVLEFVLSHAVHVRLNVYDLQGRRVGRLLDDRLEAGRHEVSWTPSGLPSGVYLSRLDAPSGTSSQKIILIPSHD